MIKATWWLGASLLVAGAAHAATEVEMHRVSTDGVGDSVGTITFEDSDHGLLITPAFALPPIWAMAIASIIALAVNFLGARFFAFTPGTFRPT